MEYHQHYFKLGSHLVKSGKCGVIHLHVKNNGIGFKENNNKQLTIASLHYWAKQDNPDKYKDILRKIHLKNL